MLTVCYTFFHVYNIKYEHSITLKQQTKINCDLILMTETTATATHGTKWQDKWLTNRYIVNRGLNTLTRHFSSFCFA